MVCVAAMVEGGEVVGVMTSPVTALIWQMRKPYGRRVEAVCLPFWYSFLSWSKVEARVSKELGLPLNLTVY